MDMVGVKFEALSAGLSRIGSLGSRSSQPEAGASSDLQLLLRLHPRNGERVGAAFDETEIGWSGPACRRSLSDLPANLTSNGRSKISSLQPRREVRIVRSGPLGARHGDRAIAVRH